MHHPNGPSREYGDPDMATVMEPVDPTSATVPATPSPHGRARPVGVGAMRKAVRVPEVGEFIGKYELIRELGRGGMGTVFLARDTKLGRRVAIKFLHSQNEELNERFIREARATAQFQHENIIVIHEVEEYQGSPFMVLEYLHGSPLSQMLSKGRTVTPRKAVDIMISVARALERAHSYGIVHRDLKPDNIFLTDAGTVKVLDFGIAKLMQEAEPQAAGGASSMASMLANIEHHPEEDTGSTGRTGDSYVETGSSSKLTQHGAILGTLPYMSPEQWGTSTVDHRSDIWACGILLFRMVAGKHPLAPLKGAQLVITAMLDQPMPRARQVSADIPEALADLIDRCLIKDKERRVSSATELLHALEELAPGHYSRTFRPDQMPYAGLSSFQESDAAKFFGRSKEIAAAVTRLQKQPLMGVVGPSGVGKSSFVRAGVVPALKRSGESWSTIVLRPGREPVSALAQAIAPMISHKSTTNAAADLAEIQAIHQRLYHEPGYMGVVLRHRSRRKQQKILVFVDQFEELYTLVENPNERLAFTRCLASVADDPTTPLRVVISIRSDFLDRVPEDQHFMNELGQGLFFLNKPNRHGLRDALIQPAEMAGFQFENPQMVEHMLDHLEHTPGALPLLQFAASKLWEMRDQQNRLLTQHSYDEIGGIAGALASHADAVVADLPPRNQALARTIFLRLITSDRTRAIVTVSELRELGKNPNDVQQLLDYLVQARLIVVQTGDGSGTATAEIVHESLIHSWPLLRKWLDDNQDDAVFLEQLRNAAYQWKAKGYPQGLLWRGEAMEEAKLWYRKYKGDLPELQKRYLNEVFSLAARSVRRRKIALTAFIVFLILLVAAGAVALVVITDAQREAEAQADAATKAEQKVLDQMEDVQRANDEANKEREAAEEARKKAEQAAAEIASKNQELQEAIERAEKQRQEAEEARRRAKRAERRARQEGRRAKKQAELARAAEADAKAANEQLQALLDEERRRNEELARQGLNAIIQDVEYKSEP